MSSSRNARRRRRGSPAPHGHAAGAGTGAPARSPGAASRSRPATAPGRSGPAARRPGRPAARTAALDPIALYRDSTLVGRLPRLGLLAGLLCLVTYSVSRIGSHQNASSALASLGNIGLGFVLAFIALSFVGYLRVVQRVRREDPESWKPSSRFFRTLMTAPLGVGDPGATTYDRAVLVLTVIAAAALLPLSFVSGA